MDFAEYCNGCDEPTSGKCPDCGCCPACCTCTVDLIVEVIPDELPGELEDGA
jgi:hypothetical protein